MVFSRADIANLKDLVARSLENLAVQDRQPLEQQEAWHKIPREQRRAKHDAHAMQAALSKRYGDGFDESDGTG